MRTRLLEREERAIHTVYRVREHAGERGEGEWAKRAILEPTTEIVHCGKTKRRIEKSALCGRLKGNN